VKSSLIWVRVPENQAWAKWWPEFLKAHESLKAIEVQKFNGMEVSWGIVGDALFSFSLFHKKKVIVVTQADKFLKKEKKWMDIALKWMKAPHTLVLVSEDEAPAHWTYQEWRTGALEDSQDEKAVFRWIDAIHSESLDSALKELQICIDNGQVALVALQLLSRHFRLGRLIQYATDKGFSDQEIAAAFKIPSFAIQKWRKKSRRHHRQWLKIFEYLQAADLQLKSNEDSRWTLRMLTLKMVRQELQARRQTQKQNKSVFLKPSELFSQPLLPIEPSFS